MKQQNESVKKLEIGKDYINVHYNNVIVIDRTEGITNRGFAGREYRNDLNCSIYSNWREATEEEVVEAFKRHLVYRYGKDWETMKIKEMHPSSSSAIVINDGLWEVEISKEYDGWNVWNKNGLLYCNGTWVEMLEEPKITIKDAIKENTVVHCETEREANRILGMSHTLGYSWWTGKSYKNNTEWGIYKSKMCYDLFEGAYSHYDYYNNKNYTIIPSTQIADLEPEKSTDWAPAPTDIEAMNKSKKASQTQIGGNHYSDMAIQPTEFIHKNGLSFIQGNVIKYVCRYKDKVGIEDLNKAKHYIDLLIELEEE